MASPKHSRYKEKDITPLETPLAEVIKGSGGGKQEQEGPYEAPNTLKINSIVRLIDLLSEGPILGLLGGGQSVFLDDTPYQRGDGTFNFEATGAELVEGDPDQRPLQGYAATGTVISVGAELTQMRSLTRRFVIPNADAVRIIVRVPSLFRIEDDGDTVGNRIDYRIRIRNVSPGFSQEWFSEDYILEGKSNSPYERGHRRELPVGGPEYEVEMTQQSEDSDSLRDSARLSWVALSLIFETRFSYPDTAIMGWTVSADQFDSRIPRREYEILGLRINVPSNYNAQFGSYRGLWDGTFKLSWTNNPAWVLYDLLTNTRYGLGDVIKPEQVDKWGLYSIAQYCDELVVNGRGNGFEPRYTFNGVVKGKKEAYNALAEVASNFRGMIYWGNGSIGFTQDRPTSPSKLVTRASVIDGAFSYSSTPLKTRFSVALVKWQDPLNAYKESIEVIEDQEAIEKYGWRAQEIPAFGCTSKGQANRLGRWFLYTNQNETETVAYQTGFDHAEVRPGDVVKIQDPDYAGTRYGGRLMAVTNPSPNIYSLQLDDTIILPAGEKSISISQSNGQLYTANISTSVSGNVDRVNVILPDPIEPPIVGGLWVISIPILEPRLFRVISVVEDEKHLFNITCLQHNPGKYAFIERGVQLETENVSFLTTQRQRPLPKPLSCNMVENIYQETSGPRSVSTISVEPAADPRIQGSEVQIRESRGEPWEQVASTSGNLSYTVRNTKPIVYQIRARHEGAGLRSAWLNDSFDIAAVRTPPPDIEGFRAEVRQGQIVFHWTNCECLDISHYEIRYSPPGAPRVWGNANRVIRDIAFNQVEASVIAIGGIYYIKAFDWRGKESIIASEVVVEVEDIDAFRPDFELRLGYLNDRNQRLTEFTAFHSEHLFPPEPEVDYRGLRWKVFGRRLPLGTQTSLSPLQGNERPSQVVSLIDTQVVEEEVTPGLVDRTVQLMPMASMASLMSQWESLSDVRSLSGGASVTRVPREGMYILGGIYPYFDYPSEDLPTHTPVATEIYPGILTARHTMQVEAVGKSVGMHLEDFDSLTEMETLSGDSYENWEVQCLIRTTTDRRDSITEDSWTEWEPVSREDISSRYYQIAVRLISLDGLATPVVRQINYCRDITANVEVSEQLFSNSLPFNGGNEASVVGFTEGFWTPPSLVVTDNPLFYDRRLLAPFEFGGSTTEIVPGFLVDYFEYLRFPENVDALVAVGVFIRGQFVLEPLGPPTNELSVALLQAVQSVVDANPGSVFIPSGEQETQQRILANRITVPFTYAVQGFGRINIDNDIINDPRNPG